VGKDCEGEGELIADVLAAGFARNYLQVLLTGEKTIFKLGLIAEGTCKMENSLLTAF
jgi:hypothetical protein